MYKRQDKLSVFQGQTVIKTKTEEQVQLKGVVSQWIDPKSKDEDEDEDEAVEITFEGEEDQ
mgnify:FL=1